MTTPYTHLFFDADGTLFDFEASQADALKLTFAQFNLDFQPDYLETYHRINEHLWSEFENNRLTQVQAVVQRFEKLFSQIPCFAEPEVFNTTYLQNLAGNNNLLPGARELIESLFSQFHMLILTNGVASVQRQRIAKSCLADYFEEIIISEEIGATKPDPLIFSAAFQRIGNPPKQQVLMIGDSLNADIFGANQFGIDACWFNPRHLPSPEGFEIRFEITDLNELISLLE
jgi:2-haloacid dehalogenase